MLGIGLATSHLLFKTATALYHMDLIIPIIQIGKLRLRLRNIPKFIQLVNRRIRIQAMSLLGHKLQSLDPTWTQLQSLGSSQKSKEDKLFLLALK